MCAAPMCMCTYIYIPNIYIRERVTRCLVALRHIVVEVHNDDLNVRGLDHRVHIWEYHLNVCFLCFNKAFNCDIRLSREFRY